MDIKFSMNANEISIYKLENVPGTDYFWFLTSLCKGIINNYRIEVMDDSNGHCEEYKLRDFTLSYLSGSEGISDNISLDLENIKTKDIKIMDLNNIKRVEENDNSTPGEYYKYYVYSASGNYRFIFFCKSRP